MGLQCSRSAGVRAGGDNGLASVHVHAKVLAGAVLERMLLAQLVQYVCCVKAGVVAELAGDDLQGLCICIDNQLRLAGYRPGVVPQIPAGESKRQLELCAGKPVLLRLVISML